MQNHANPRSWKDFETSGWARNACDYASCAGRLKTKTCLAIGMGYTPTDIGKTMHPPRPLANRSA